MRRAKNAPQESTLPTSCDFARTILDQVRDIILIAGMDSRVLYANPAALAAYGYSETEMLALCMNDLTHQHSFDEHSPFFHSVHLRKNGECFPVEINSRQILFRETPVILNTIRDITAVSTAEAALWQSEQKYHTLNSELTATNEELTATNEELTAINEELRNNIFRIFL